MSQKVPYILGDLAEEKYFDDEDSPVNKRVSWRVLLNVF